MRGQRARRKGFRIDECPQEFVEALSDEVQADA
jgi:hypothetical protein